MCGFVALFQPRCPIDPELLDAMTDRMAHRGPDGRGTLIEPGVGLGHRRLAIIDVNGGAQPMRGADPRFTIVFNGEVYNYQSAKENLPGPWRTDSDTEVFLRSFEKNGIAGLDHLVGMWGAAIWDAKTHTGTVVRDRLGIKPVYYAPLTEGGYAFASEIRALLVHPDVDRTFDTVALEQLLTYRYVPAPRTMHRGIRKLPPGCAARVTESGLDIIRYWAPRPDPTPIEDAAAEAAFLAAFDLAVTDRKVSDVPVGLFLSGGVDSAAILNAMGPGVSCFTIGFEGETEDDEIAYAKETAKQFQGRSYTTHIGPNDYAVWFDRYAEALEEPVLNDSALATWFLARLAKEHGRKVVLSGQGADEPLAGYDRHKGAWLSPHLARWLDAGRLTPWLGSIERTGASEKIKRAFRSVGEPDEVLRTERMYAVFQAADKARLLHPEVRHPEAAQEPIRRFHAEVSHLSPLGRMLYTDTRLWLPDDLLLVADKLTMAAGVEMRVPFLDHRLITLVESFPDTQKLRWGTRGLVTKAVHRRAMAKRLPSAILERKKRGFNNPMDRWLRTSLAHLVQERLLSSSSPLRPWFRSEGLHDWVQDHQSGRHDRRRGLFLLLTLEAWLRAYR